jgi:hypothetical protein
LRLIRFGVVALVLISCSAQTSSAPSPTASPQAGDLRVRLDLLLGENVVIIAKESEAAANHSDQYASYTALLTANANDLTSLMRLAFGNTSADEFARLWAAQNTDYVDYAIGVVTHDQDKTDTAISHLTTDSAPKVVGLLTGLLHLRTGELDLPLKNAIAAMKGTIDQGFAQNYLIMYGDLHNAFVWAAQLGDHIAPAIAQSFPDKFPGDASSGAVATRALTNELLMERAYLLTMATDATLNGRATEKTEALAALKQNATSLGRFKDVWAQQVQAVEGYAATSDDASRLAITQTFVAQLSSTAQVSATLVADQAGATMKVIDDQRAKAFKTVAGDDRAAATAMQPIADAMAS